LPDGRFNSQWKKWSGKFDEAIRKS